MLASQADRARSNIGAAEKLVDSVWRVHRDRATNSDSIIPSKHRRADRRWVRWNARPMRPRANAVEKLKCIGVIRGLWTLTIII